MRKCRKCGKILTRKLRYLGNDDYAEEYKDGLCVECWIEEHKSLIETAKVILCS